jgi:hypothetical protein
VKQGLLNSRRRFSTLERTADNADHADAEQLKREQLKS